MALIDVIKWESETGVLCHKFPSENLRLGSQLVVYPAQTAFFVKGGRICDEFTSGTYTLHTGNIPLLSGLMSIPFGGDTPFQAEVWFINQTIRLDMKWGTSHPMQLEDPRYEIIFPVRAYGSYGIKIVEPRVFLESLLGNMSSFSQDNIDTYFKGKIISHLSALIAQKIALDNTSVLDINTQLVGMSVFCNLQLNEVFSKYGVELIDFSIMSVTIPADDPSLMKLKEAKDMAARLKITGKDVYQMEKSFDVLEKAASNEGAGGQFVAMGAGLGAGIGIGNVAGGMAANVVNAGLQPPPLPDVRYFVYLNGTQRGNLSFSEVSHMIATGIVERDTLIWTAGMPAWKRVGEMSEFSACIAGQTPPPLPL